jgi:hypothetical protein
MAAVLACAAAPVASALDVGISDQAPEAFADPRLAELPIGHARLVVPWDVVYAAPEGVDAWLASTARRGLVPLVAFERGAGQTCPEQCTEPTTTEYADAVRAFRARWPQVRELTPWNEPNHPAQPTARNPSSAAAYHDVVRAICPSCTVIAGDFVDSANMKSYFRAYADSLRARPMVWGIHNYGDVTYERPSYLTWLADQVTTSVWMTETGGIVRLGSGATASLPEDVDRAATSIDRVFAAARARPDQIARVYLYQWRAAPGDAFDAGLVAPNGNERPGLARLRALLGPKTPSAADHGDEPATAVPAGGSQPTAPARSGAVHVTSSAAVTTTTYGSTAAMSAGRPVRVLGGLRVRVTCPAARRVGCRGSITVVLRVFQRHEPLRLARATVVLRGGKAMDLRLAVPRQARRIWNRALAWQLRTVSVVRAPTGVQDRTWAARRRT